ncbi:hypothetical protein PY365_06590 [Roseiarcaceae bacterium H3SJ34-1]|uniref:hypothetical protein n=1 Tax=Terripilifer ovatus TaxID=3032367 RepID=UPI003AB926E1|nr:hypothetical protein [Roseiarcaceae bacterium H3SJ34-1]
MARIDDGLKVAARSAMSLLTETDAGSHRSRLQMQEPARALDKALGKSVGGSRFQRNFGNEIASLKNRRFALVTAY